MTKPIIRKRQATTKEDDEAARLRGLGLNRELEIPRASAAPHPSRGGTRGYNISWRLAQLKAWEEGGDTTASDRSLYRWRRRLVPHRMTGNKESDTLVGIDLFSMVLYKKAYPSATLLEVATFIYNQTGSVYADAQISVKLRELGVSRKRASTEAYQAFTPINLLKFRQFWTLPYPLGVNGVARKKLIDFNKFGIYLAKVETKYGHTATSVRARKAGHFTKSCPKLNVIIAIKPGDPTIPAHMDGSVERPRKWIRIFRDGGTDKVQYAAFCEQVCTSIEQHPAPGNVDSDRYFIWDNLSAHKTALIHHTVEGQPNSVFSIVCRPPYQPKVAPAEYKICDICLAVQPWIDERSTTDGLEQKVYDIFAELGDDGNFNNSFDHCGYTEDGIYPPGGYDP